MKYYYYEQMWIQKWFWISIGRFHWGYYGHISAYSKQDARVRLQERHPGVWFRIKISTLTKKEYYYWSVPRWISFDRFSKRFISGQGKFFSDKELKNHLRKKFPGVKFRFKID